MRPLLLAPLALAMLGAAARGQSSEIASVVLGLAGPADAVTIERGERRPARLWAALYAGDVIQISRPDAAVTIQTNTGVFITVAGDCGNRPACTAAPYQITRQAFSRTGSFFAALLNVFAGPLPPQPSGLAGGDALAPPRLGLRNAAAQSIASGRRALVIPVAGAGPVTLTIRQGQRRHGPYRSRAGVVRTGRIDLAPGSAALELRDAHKQASTFPLTVVAAPPKPAWLDPSDARDATGRLAWAAWLVVEDRGQWSLEAMQLLAPIAGRQPAAEALLDRVAVSGPDDRK